MAECEQLAPAWLKSTQVKLQTAEKSNADAKTLCGLFCQCCSGSLQAKYTCSDPSTATGLEECLTVLLAPKGSTDSLTLVYEAPSLTSAEGAKMQLVRVDNSTVKVQVGEGVPLVPTVDESIDGVPGAQWDGFLIATDFAMPYSSGISAIRCCLS